MDISEFLKRGYTHFVVVVQTQKDHLFSSLGKNKALNLP